MSRRRRTESPEPPPRRRGRAAAAVAALIVAAIAAAALFRRAPTPAEPPRNVLLITVDTLRADALGAYGRRGAATPWMDRLAADGVRFDDAHAHNVVTLPSHANILSGRLPFEHGVRDNAGFRFPATLPTLATLLKERGFRTGAFVSAFPLDARFGLARGFDVYDDAFLGAAAPTPFLLQERPAAATVARARRFVDGTAGPWFCWVHVFDPHFPYEPPEPFASRFAGRPYDGEVAAADDALGALLGPLLATPTLIVLTADHGESLGEHGEATHGVFAYEATLRVPLLLHGPGLAPAVVGTPARHVDILPTVLDALRIQAPAGLPGRSLLATSAAPAATYFEALSGFLHRGWAPLRGVITDRVKYVELPRPEAYDLAGDPTEQTNLASTRPLAALRAALAGFPLALPSAPPEDAEALARLRALGYAAAGPQAPGRDPKDAIGAEAGLQDVIGRYRSGDVAGALAAARAVVDRDPDPVALLHLAHLERESGHLDAGVRALQRALALQPRDTTTAALLGAYLTQAGRAEEAVALLAPYDADVEALLARSLALARLGRTDEALAQLGRARALEAPAGRVLVQEGTVRAMAGDRTGARRAFTDAAALEDAPARALSSLALLDAEEGRTAEALAGFERAIDADAGESAQLLAAASLLARREREAEARPFLELFARRAPAARFPRELQQVRAWLARSRG